MCAKFGDFKVKNRREFSEQSAINDRDIVDTSVIRTINPTISLVALFSVKISYCVLSIFLINFNLCTKFSIVDDFILQRFSQVCTWIDHNLVALFTFIYYKFQSFLVRKCCEIRPLGTEATN